MPLYRINDKLIFFVHIPKTGGTSIEAALENVGDVCFSKNPKFFPVPAQHLHAEFLDVLFPQGFYDKGFAICRNPYARLISEYRHQIVRGRFERIRPDAWIQKIFRRYKKDSFLHHNHIRPQAEFINDSMDVFRFEDGLEKIIQSIFRYCCVEPSESLPRIKIYEKKEIELSKKSLRYIEDFYRVDFDAFGYDPADLSFAAEDRIKLI